MENGISRIVVAERDPLGTDPNIAGSHYVTGKSIVLENIVPVEGTVPFDTLTFALA